MIVLAQISDLHFNGTARNSERVARVMDYLNGFPQPVDALLVTGDIADRGLVSEYTEARKFFEGVSSPVLLLPGNHDERKAYREALLDEEPDCAPINEAHLIGGVLFAMLDSSIPERADGLLADETLEWLEDLLSDTRDDVPVFVCFHHPPVEVHNDMIDGIRQFGEQRLAEIAARYPQVVAFLCGHAHTAGASTFAGRPLLIAPGVASTLLLPWESEQDISLELPPAFALHILDDSGRLTTHYRSLPMP